MSAQGFDDFRRAMLLAHDAASTIAMRTLAMQRAFLAGDFSGGVEAQRMVTEKILAAQQGFFAAAIASAGELAAPPVTKRQAEASAARIVSAAAKPAAKKVRANAKRLTAAKASTKRARRK